MASRQQHGRLLTRPTGPSHMGLISRTREEEQSSGRGMSVRISGEGITRQVVDHKRAPEIIRCFLSICRGQCLLGFGSIPRRKGMKGDILLFSVRLGLATRPEAEFKALCQGGTRRQGSISCA